MGDRGGPPKGPWPQNEGRNSNVDFDTNLNIVIDDALVSHIDPSPESGPGTDADTLVPCVLDP